MAHFQGFLLTSHQVISVALQENVVKLPMPCTTLRSEATMPLEPTADRFCLIVDDEPAIRKYLKAILQRGQIQSIEAESPVRALQLLQQFGNKINLIITDIQMPGDMDGIDLAYSVRNSDPTLPVILISGYADKKIPANFPFVQKPFDAQAILDTVSMVTLALN
jgi:DNA-binding NtrC family response regulator